MAFFWKRTTHKSLIKDFGFNFNLTIPIDSSMTENQLNKFLANVFQKAATEGLIVVGIQEITRTVRGEITDMKINVTIDNKIYDLLESEAKK